MKNILFVSLVAVVALFSMPVAWAQVYSYPGYQSGTVSAAPCVSLSRDLSIGTRGTDVTSLQSFLVAQNYPGSGSWMVTGYFGKATQAALMNFQRSRGLSATGVADRETRSLLGTCGYPNYSYGNYPYAAPVSITALSTYSGQAGTSVVVYGSGFDASYNTVYFGATPIPGFISSNGSSLTFTVPSNASNCSGYGCYSFGNTPSGTYQVYVMNTRGTSNRLNFVVLGGVTGVGCGYYGGYCGGGYTYGIPSISYLNPNFGSVGTNITVYGSSFSPRNNSVTFGTGVISGLSSLDGTSLSFTVPSQLIGYGSQTLTLGTYGVSVTNEQGLRSNSLSFSVTGLTSSATAPTIQSISGPTSLPLGIQGTWAASINNQSSSQAVVSVRWGDEGPYGVAQTQSTSLVGVQTISYTHTYYQRGTFTITFTVTNASGLSNTSTITVTVQ